MKNVDVELIQRVLDGDDIAFSELVRKYQKSVHALAWRKTQDFHIAEDITQETFLKAYKGLSTLKEPQSFASWLYVIATNHSKTWLSKNRLQTQSLEDTDNTELEKAPYSSYVSAENERASVEAQREVVKKLLAKLQESDRTVITLYYLGGMTYEEISRFLGVSVNAIKSRIYRARQFLKKEEPMIREALQKYQITPHLTENIMREIARLKPATPTGGKPLMPWAVAVSSAILILFLLGLGSQHLLRFQQPYSLDAQAETTVELVDTPIVLNLEVKADVQNQLGLSNPIGKSDNNGQKPDEVLLAAAQVEGEDVSIPKQQWIQSEPVIGSKVDSIHATPHGELYVIDRNLNIYKLQGDGKGWQHIYDVSSLNTRLHPSIPIATWKNTIYILTSNQFYSSSDSGKSWDLIYTWQNAFTPLNLILTEQAFYAVFDLKIYRSEDAGKTWETFNDGLKPIIYSIVENHNTLFAETDTGLYRLNADSWELVKFQESAIGGIRSIAATKEKLYVAAYISSDVAHPNKVADGLARGWWIFRSSDLGNSWEDITPTNAWPINGFMPHLKLFCVGETLLVMERGMVRSTNGGDTWMPAQLSGTTPDIDTRRPIAAVNAQTIYVDSKDGLHRSTDSGKSWKKVNITQDKGEIHNIIILKKADSRNNPHTIYGRVGDEIVQTTDRGKSWKNVHIGTPMTEPEREEDPTITHIARSGGVIYAKSGNYSHIKDLRLYRVSENGNTLMPIKDMPFIFSGAILLRHLDRRNTPFDLNQLQERIFGAAQFFKQIAAAPQRSDALIHNGLQGPFSVSDNTFYLECNFKLFRWEPGDKEWQAIGQEETAELSWEIVGKTLKLAVSGDTVYVGKRDGHLVVSFDKGNNWIDLTPGLPFQVKTYKDIVVAGSTVWN